MLRILKTRKFLILKKARKAKDAILAYPWHVYGTRVSFEADYRNAQDGFDENPLLVPARDLLVRPQKERAVVLQSGGRLSCE